MNKSLVLLLPLLAWPLLAWAHFGMVIPNRDLVDHANQAQITLTLSFAHPFLPQTLRLDKPQALWHWHQGKKSNLLERLQAVEIQGQPAWQARVEIKKPGVHQFAMQPQPYFEAAENAYIQHFTKVMLAGYGNAQGWDQALGLPMELVPLTRPFGLAPGQLFQAQVFQGGKPLPGAKVEVEFFNQQGQAQAEHAFGETQEIRADSQGVFSFVANRPGWWGFAALSQAEWGLEHQGKIKELELGAVLWVRFGPLPEPPRAKP